MPIYSMTGFARTQIQVHGQLSCTLSLKSVNHRFLDLQLRLPSGLDALEMELRKTLKDALIRGHIDLTLSVDRTTQQKAGYNRELVDNYLAAFAAAQLIVLGIIGEYLGRLFQEVKGRPLFLVDQVLANQAALVLPTDFARLPPQARQATWEAIRDAANSNVAGSRAA